MSESPVTYLNDLIPSPKYVQIQGQKIAVDPLKFSTGSEIKIREAYQEESKVLENEDADVWERGLNSRKIILAVGKDVIPRVCPEWTPERVEDELSYQSVAALLSFFLSPDWRDTGPLEVMDQMTPTMTPSAPKPSKKNSPQPD